jgi:hypothetical protein
MAREKTSPSPVTDRGIHLVLLFALVAEHLSICYEPRRWPKEARAVSLVTDWPARSGRRLRVDERRQLAALSGQLARQIAATLGREAGLQTVHEMMESLDSDHQSEIERSLMVECERMLDGALADRP